VAVLAEHQTVALFIKMAHLVVLVVVAQEMGLDLMVVEEIPPLHPHLKVVLAVMEFKPQPHTQQGVVVVHLL
jgi:hypothetical protein